MASIIDECKASYPTEREVSADHSRRIAAEIRREANWRGANARSSLDRKQRDPEARLERIWDAYFDSTPGSARALQLLELLKERS